MRALGVDKTSASVRRCLYKRCLFVAVQEWIKTCDACQRNKPSDQRIAQAHIHPGAGWLSVSMITDSPLSDGFDAIFVCASAR